MASTGVVAPTPLVRHALACQGPVPGTLDATMRLLGDFWRRSEWAASAGQADREARFFRPDRPRDRVVYGGKVVHLQDWMLRWP